MDASRLYPQQMHLVDPHLTTITSNISNNNYASSCQFDTQQRRPSQQAPPRSHYSNRQQQASTGSGQQQHQLASLSPTTDEGSACASDNLGATTDQLSSLSLSTATTGNGSSSSKRPMLGGSAGKQRPPGGTGSATTVRAMGGGAQAAAHRQAALGAHTLGGAGSGAASQQQQAKHLAHSHMNHMSSSGGQFHHHPRHNHHHHHHSHHSHHAATGSTSSSDVPTTSDDMHQFAVKSASKSHALPVATHRTLAGSGLSGATTNTSGASSASNNSGNRFLLGVLFTIAEMLLFGSLTLWLYWAYQHDDGLAWQSDRKQQFNTHAALMLGGFIFLSGQAMLIHRSFQCCNRIYTKIMHTILFVLATSAISLGLLLGYTAQENIGPNNKPIMHFYSLHAWCGLCTIGLFCAQFCFGFVAFLILLCCDQSTAQFRARLLPIHRTFGLIIFSLAVATCLMGLLQTARSRLSSKLNKTDYHELAESGIVINLIGVCLIGLAILMPYIIRNLEIKERLPAAFRSRELLERHLKQLSQMDMRI